MDWKIAVVVVLGLVIFFGVKTCSDDKQPNYDKVQADQRAEREQAHEAQKTKEARERKTEAIKEARAERGERPAPKTAELTTEEYKAVFSTRGGALQSFRLLKDQFKQGPRDWSTGLRSENEKDFVQVDLVTTNANKYERYAPLRFKIIQGIDGLLPDADFKIVDQSEDHITLKYQQAGLPITIYKKFEVHPDNHPYEMWLTIRVSNTGSEKVAFLPAVLQQGWQHESETSGGMFTQQPNLQQVICRHDEETSRMAFAEAEDDDGALPYNGIGTIDFVGIESNYFLSAMIPGDDRPATCYLHARKDRVMIAELRYGEVELEPGQAATFKVKNYLGPKKFDLLQQTGHNLETSVDFGWFTPISRILLWLLLAFQAKVTNWGVAIILLTVLVKLVLIPLTHRSFKSAEKMKALKPEIDKLTEQFKDDAAGKQEATMKLYKQHKINPLGGCLPMVLQMPIWFALFRTLRSSPELYRAEFFGWITDLSSPDPYFITPVVMGAMMFIQQRLTPMSGDSAQQKMMGYVMPIMFSGFMLFLPSGLTLYILVNTVLSIAHQAIIHRNSIAQRMQALKLNAGKKAARKK